MKGSVKTTQMMATFVGGLLKPDETLPLAEHTRVKLTIELVTEPVEAASAWEAMKARLRQRPVHAAGECFGRDELHDRR